MRWCLRFIHVLISLIWRPPSSLSDSHWSSTNDTHRYLEKMWNILGISGKWSTQLNKVYNKDQVILIVTYYIFKAFLCFFVLTPTQITTCLHIWWMWTINQQPASSPVHPTHVQRSRAYAQLTSNRSPPLTHAYKPITSSAEIGNWQSQTVLENGRSYFWK